MDWARPGEIEVTVIDKSPFHEFRPSYLWVMTGIREPDDIRRPLKLMERYGVKVVQDEIMRIDPGDRRVIGVNASYEYDYLVVSLGAETIRTPALGDSCAPWEMDGALECRSKLRGFKGKRIVVGPASMPYRCPPAPFEVAFMLKYLMELRGVTDVKVTVFHEWREPMEPFGPMMVSAFKRLLAQYDIDFIGGVRFDHVDAESRKIVFANGDSLDYDLAIVVPPHRPPKPILDSDLVNKQSGYMDVKLPRLRHTRYDDVFGIGDVIAPTLGLGMAGVFAHFQAEHVATQILDEVRGAFMGEDYNMSGVCEMDLGYMGAMVYCDFSKKLRGEAPYPECRMIGGAKAFRGAKIVFEKVWFATLFGG